MIGGSTAAQELAELKPWPNPAPAISRDERLARIAKAQGLMTTDAMIIGAGASLRYFAGVGWNATERLVAMVLPKTGEPVMICPRFEEGSLVASLGIAAPLRLWEEHESPYVLTAQVLAEWGARSLAIDPALDFAMFDALRLAAPDVSMPNAAPVVDGCRMIKSAAELALMSQAKAMTLEVHKRAARILAPGVTTGEVRRFIDQAHRALGADDGSSFCAVQFGQASAYPHGLPGEQQLADDELVLIDTGCRVQGYNSDITRTYVYGQATQDQLRVWDIEKKAQAAAFAAVKPGVACEEIDAVARRVLAAEGFSPDYDLPGLPHRTGHGIGLSIHEAPYLVRGDKTPLQPGMCFSNEPMIVIEGEFGVRLEDHFHVTETGAAWFTPPQPAIDKPVA
ncbi:MAG: Xaa-Pro peptidase family protein [Alphaproteobacteria bacterium]|nr:Xaa-Pro peptidase family protein [Alphaproteobacteria bacterium]MBU1517248.1 Xaa-Pro peptidase family protein [Alphaproteobacteria bacterium]MBU2093216.1 Xaa-Pro peptidase family protein [Alphaproteobacteria bacterium]MBU2153158.1 Xaa-Pro peptidase family protein [Alphaproteobacteria bacterium]MBU2307864.1 Xaa-Pro peptidase family protein [Alphaproteobacteria bacterium]